MKRRFTDEQVIGILREQEAGSAVKEITRRHGISEQSFYRWQAKYGGMDVSDAHRLKELEAGNAKLKRFLAEAHLENAALKASRSDGRQARSAESGGASPWPPPCGPSMRQTTSRLGSNGRCGSGRQPWETRR